MVCSWARAIVDMDDQHAQTAIQPLLLSHKLGRYLSSLQTLVASCTPSAAEQPTLVV